MGRNVKKGLAYYPMDVDIVSDIKIRKLIKRHKGQAFAVYALLLCSIYKNGYYIHWDDDLPFILAEQTGLSEKYILQVINYCIGVGLFSADLYEQEKILTSRAIQERYSFICKQCKRKSPIQDYALTTPDETPQSEQTPSPGSNQTNTTPPVAPRPIKDVYVELGKYAQCREDVWEAAAITKGFTSELTNYYRNWLQLDDNERHYPLNELNQALRKQCGEINIEWYNAICWCKDNLSDIDNREIYGIAGSKPQALTELRFAIKEIGKGKITQPGAFILSRLRKV